METLCTNLSHMFYNGREKVIMVSGETECLIQVWRHLNTNNHIKQYMHARFNARFSEGKMGNYPFALLVNFKHNYSISIFPLYTMYCHQYVDTPPN